MASSNISATLSPESVDLSADPRWQLAERAANSAALIRATQLRAILLYIVHHAILHSGEPLREYEIACRVLGRRNDFNPIDDNIVRVQMGHLRKKLDLYFSSEGSHEPTIITLHRGSYMPVFEERTVSATEEATGQSAHPTTEPIHAVVPRWLMIASIAAALAIGVLAGRYFRNDHGDTRALAAGVTNPILRRIFVPNVAVNVVVADISLAVLQNTAHTDISVAEYLDHNYPDNVLANLPDPNVRATLAGLSHRRFTSLDDADVVGHSFQWGSLLGARPTVRYARDLHVRDFEQGNFIIVGSRRGNPWASLFEHDLNFSFEEDSNHNPRFRNRSPLPGEAAFYSYTPQPDGQTIGYVDIALLPNLTLTGTVLLLNGFSMETNEAAANLIFRSDIAPAISKAMSSQPPNSRIEILLRVHNLDGSDNGSDIISIRTDTPASHSLP